MSAGSGVGVTIAASELESLTMNGFKTVLDIDLIGTFNASKACLPAFKQVWIQGQAASSPASAGRAGSILADCRWAEVL